MKNRFLLVVAFALLALAAVALAAPAPPPAGVTVTPATGGTGVSADIAANAPSPGTKILGDIVIDEGADTDFSTGSNVTLILVPPTGWSFSGTGSPVLSVSHLASRDITASAIAVTSSTLTVTYSVDAVGDKTDKLTIKNLRVQPNDGLLTNTPAGNITRSASSTGVINGISGATNFGSLSMTFGDDVKLGIGTQPTTATAGVVFSPNPVVRVEDYFGNLVTSDSSTKVKASRNTASGTAALQGTLTLQQAASGLVTFTNISYNKAETIKIDFAEDHNNPSLTGVTSANIVVSAANASKLRFSTQPGGAAAGSAFTTQPVIKTADPFDNDTANGIAASVPVTISIATGSGTLLGTTSYDIGTGSGNGTVTASGLQINEAGAFTLQAADGALTTATSESFTVSPGPAATITKLAGDEQTGPAGATLPTDPSVRVEDAYGNDLSGTTVTFTPTAGSGSVTGGTQSTDGSGVATVTSWTLGDVAGIHTLDVASGDATASFTATATCAYASKASGNWNSPSTWFGECVPTASDDVTINSGHTVTVTADASAASLTFASIVDVDAAVAINSGVTLTIAGDVEINAPSTSGETATLNVGDGVLSAGGSLLLDGAGNRTGKLSIGNLGVASFTGSVSFGSNQATQIIEITGNGQLNVGGDFGAGGTFVLSSGAVFRMNGSAPRTIGAYNPSEPFGNLVIAGDVTLLGKLTIEGTLTIDADASLDAGSDQLRLEGDMVDNGSFTSSGMVKVQGAALQTFSGTESPIPFDDLQMLNPEGLVLETSISVAGTLTIDGGNIDAGTNTVTILGTGSVDRTTGHVIGNLAKVYTAAAAKAFEVGSENGYSPVDVDATDGTFPGTFTIAAVEGPHPNSPTTLALQRYWTLDNGSITGADLDFTYLAGDVVGNELFYVLGHYDGLWSYPTATVDTVNHVASADAVTDFSDFTLHQDVATLGIDHFVVEAAAGGDIPEQIVDVPFSIRVTAVDASEETVEEFTGTVDITSTGTLSSGDGTTAAMAAGVLASHGVTISSIGTFTISATRTGGKETGTSNEFEVVGIPDLTLAIGGSNLAIPGDLEVYRFTITNQGPGPGFDSMLTLSLPSGWVPAPSATCPVYPCALGTIPAGASFELEVEVDISSSAAYGWYNVGATISSPSGDLNLADNGDSMRVRLVECPVVEDLAPGGAAPTSGNLTWSSPQGDRFDVYLGPAGSGCSMFVGETKDRSFPYADLEAGATYEWRVVARRAGCARKSSACVTFTASCAPPTIEGIAETTTGSTYHVGWSSIDAATSYVLEEATNADFTGAVSQTVNDVHAMLSKTVEVPTAFYYRVRAATCPDAWSLTLRVVVQPAASPDGTEFNLSIEQGADEPVVQTVLVPSGGNSSAARSAQAGSFTASANVPWITVSPAAGTISGDLLLTATINPTGLPVGTSSGMVSVQSTDGAEIATYAIHLHAMTAVEETGKPDVAGDGWIVPVVAHVAGSDSLWRSDVRLFNPSSEAATYEVYFTPSGQDGRVNGRRTTITIPAGMTIALDDVVRRPFGYGALGETAFGALDLRAGNEAARGGVFTSRTFNVTPDGTYGQFIPAVPRHHFAAAGTTLSLQQLGHSAERRTNAGVVEGSGFPATVKIRIYDDAGQLAAEAADLSLLPYEHRQIDSILAVNGVQAEDARLEVEVVSSAGAVTAYASVVDNGTNDPLAVSAVERTAPAGTRFVAPGIAHIDTFDNHWRSDVRIYNPGSAAVEATLLFHPQGGGTPLSHTVTIGGGATRSDDNIVQSLFGATNRFGALHVVTPGPGLIVTARTYDRQTGGTYGQFIPAMTVADAAVLGGAARQILHVDESALFRSNIGIAEVSGHSARVVVEVWTGDGRAAAREIDLGAHEFRQLGSLLSSLGLVESSNARVQVRVIGGDGAVIAYSSTIDNGTQDPTFIPAQ